MSRLSVTSTDTVAATFIDPNTFSVRRMSAKGPKRTGCGQLSATCDTPESSGSRRHSTAANKQRRVRALLRRLAATYVEKARHGSTNRDWPFCVRLIHRVVGSTILAKQGFGFFTAALTAVDQCGGFNHIGCHTSMVPAPTFRDTSSVYSYFPRPTPGTTCMRRTGVWMDSPPGRRRYPALQRNRGRQK